VVVLDNSNEILWLQVSFLVANFYLKHKWSDERINYLPGCLTKDKLFANFKSKTGNILLIFISIKHMDINIIHDLWHKTRP
jgi:hypothetical protein